MYLVLFCDTLLPQVVSPQTADCTFHNNQSGDKTHKLHCPCGLLLLVLCSVSLYCENNKFVPLSHIKV